jgi:hypothetical protein
MRGPIDYIIVGFEGHSFDGSILRAVADAIDQGVIGLVALSVIDVAADGTVSTLDLNTVGDDTMLQFSQKYKVSSEYVTQDDIDEMAGLLQNDTTAGLLVIEQLWAKPLKKALLDANGVLLAEGRIHPDAAAELEGEEK